MCRISPYKLIIRSGIASVCSLNCRGVYGCAWRHISRCAVFKIFVSCEPHDGCCGRDSWQASMPRPSFRKAKAPLGMPEHSLEGGSTTEGCKHGHFKLVGSPKRKNYTDPGGGCRTRRQQLRVLVSQTEVSRLSHCLSMYTDPALASLDSTLRAIHCFHLLHDKRFHYVQIKFL